MHLVNWCTLKVWVKSSFRFVFLCLGLNRLVPVHSNNSRQAGRLKLTWKKRKEKREIIAICVFDWQRLWWAALGSEVRGARWHANEQWYKQFSDCDLFWVVNAISISWLVLEWWIKSPLAAAAFDHLMAVKGECFFLWSNQTLRRRPLTYFLTGQKFTGSIGRTIMASLRCHYAAASRLF